MSWALGHLAPIPSADFDYWLWLPRLLYYMCALRLPLSPSCVMAEHSMYLKALISLASRSPCSLVTGACLFCRLIERRGKIERKEGGHRGGGRLAGSGRRAQAFQDCDKARGKGKRRRRRLRLRSKQLAAIVIGFARLRLALDNFSLMANIYSVSSMMDVIAEDPPSSASSWILSSGISPIAAM